MTSSILAWLERHQLFEFFALVFGIKCIVLSLLLAFMLDLLPYRNPFGIVTLLAYANDYAPTLSAIILTTILSGMKGIRELISRIVLWRVGMRWYFFVLSFQASISFFAIILHTLLSGTAPNFSNLSEWYLVFFILPFAFLEGPLQEELGWRGYALPRLLSGRSALSASLILGLIWGFWHLPTRLLMATDFTIMSFFWFILWVVALSILFTWVYINTKGSLLIVLLFHAAINTTVAYIPNLHEKLGPLNAGLAWIVAITVVKVFGPDHLSRSRFLESYS